MGIVTFVFADFRLVLGSFEVKISADKALKTYKKRVSSVQYTIRNDGKYYVLEVVGLRTKGIAKELKKALLSQDAYIKESSNKLQKSIKKDSKLLQKPKEKEYVTLYKVVLPSRTRARGAFKDVEKIGKIFSVVDNYPVFEIYIRDKHVTLEKIAGIVHAKTIQTTIQNDYPTAKILKDTVNTLIKSSKKNKMAYKKEKKQKKLSYIEKIAKPLYKIVTKERLDAAQSTKAKLFFQKIANDGGYSLKVIQNAKSHTIVISGIEHMVEAESILELIIPYYQNSMLNKYYVIEMI